METFNLAVGHVAVFIVAMLSVALIAASVKLMKHFVVPGAMKLFVRAMFQIRLLFDSVVEKLPSVRKSTFEEQYPVYEMTGRTRPILNFSSLVGPRTASPAETASPGAMSRNHFVN